MKVRIIAILMVAICSFTITANAQRTSVTVRTPGAAVHVNNGRGYQNVQRYRGHNTRYERRHHSFHRRNANVYNGYRMQARRVWVPAHRSRGHWVPGHYRVVRR